MSTATLACAQLTRAYRSGFAVGPLSFQLRPGVTCLVGPNGAGKSTFFRMAAGVDQPTAGSITRAGADQVGYLPQSPQLPGNATAQEFLTYVAWLAGVPKSQRAAAVESALERVQLTEHAEARIRTLSGGMARRLGIAHALIQDPQLLLLDEPTAALDPRQRLAVREVISSLGQEAVVLVSTHLVEDVRGMADRVLVLDRGQLVFDGSVAELEALADPLAPGDTDLERALATLMGAE